MVHLSALAFVFLLAVPLVSAQEVLQGLYSPDGIVRDAAIAGDTLYVGGTFGFVGGSTGTVAVLDKETGAPDLTQPRFGGVVWDMISDGTGGHYVGGAFSSVDGQPRWNLAHVRADGTLNPDFRPDPFGQINPDYFGSVEALFLHEGVLYVGGRFDVVAGQPRRNLAALDAATGTLLPLSVTMTTENQGGADPRGFVETVAARAGVLYVGGLFNEVNGTIREGAFALRLSTGEILPWNPMLNQEADLESGEATALGFGETTVYVFGIFDTVRGAPRGGSAEVSLADPVTGEGGIPTAWNPGLSGGGPDIVITDEYIWSASFFPPALRRISRTTGQSQPVNSLGNPYNYGSDVTYDPEGGVSGQGTLYVAASRLDINAPRGRYNVIVGVDPATMQRTGYEVLAGVGTLGNDRIRSLAVTPGPDGRVIAGGEPVTYGGAPRRFLAGLDLTTGQVTGFGEEYIVFSSVDETTTSPDERFLYFLTFNGIGVGDLTTGELYAFPGGAALTAHHEARFESDTLAVRRAGPVVARRDGTPAPAFRAPPSESLRGSGNDRAVRGGTGALVASAERLYAHPEGGVVAFDRATGATLWTTPFPETVAAPDVPKLLLIEGGPPGAAGDTLFASGMIREVGGDPARTRFVALDAETGAVLDFATGTGPITSGTYGSGLAAVPGDGHIFLGGSGFTQAGGFPRRGIFAADRTTGAVGPWNPNPSGAQASVKALAAQAGPDGRAAVVYAAAVRDVQPPQSGTPPLVGAFDAETGARLPWSMPVEGEMPSFLLLAERQGWVVAGGAFGAFGSTSAGRSYLVAVRPAVPFVVSEADEPTGAPAGALALAGPNPFRSRTALALSLPSAGHVSAVLYDVLGRRVAVLHDGLLGTGTHTLTINGSPLPAGVYVARVTGASFSASQALTLVK